MSPSEQGGSKRSATVWGVSDYDRRTRLRFALTLLWPRLKGRLAASLRQSTEYSRANMRTFGIVAIVGHPLYYYVWTHVAPQAYENLWLRVFSVIVAIPMLMEPQLARSRFWRGKLDWYWLFILLYMLPYFFVFMALMNSFSPIWSLSVMAAFMLLVILVFDWLMTLLLAALGSVLAWLTFMLVRGQMNGDGMPLEVLVPTYLFGLVAGSAFNYKTELVAREKLAAITAAVGTMAHELRTPLLGIRSGARGLQTYLPSIFDGYELARDNGLKVAPVRRAHYRQLLAVLDRIDGETEYTNAVLDMLLVNSSRQSIDESTFEPVWMHEVVWAALDRYPFHSAGERDCVSWDGGPDFRFLGSRLLMVHVLFNLLKNALHFLGHVEGGEIRIWTERSRSGIHQLHFMDTGPGIAPEVLPRIFDRFYSAMPEGQGTGIGLAFAALVMRGMRGDISCHSQLGRYTEFVMSFPALVDDDIYT